jgi:hypothetical protein
MACYLYWTQNIFEPQQRTSKSEREDGEGKGKQDAFCAIASPPRGGGGRAGLQRVYL